MKLILMALSPLVSILAFCGIVKITHRKSKELDFDESEIYK